MNSTNSTISPVPVDDLTGYVDALQVVSAILTLILFGWFWKAVKVVPSGDVVIKTFNVFLFFVGIPCLVFRGLAIQDFATLPWAFIGVFFCLRVTLFVLVGVVDLIIFRRGLGVFVADYMNSTWINTVIYGIPIYTALFGPQFAVYPIFASISSFFFQLPVQLVLFEIEEKRRPLPIITEEGDSVDLDDAWISSSFVIKESMGCSFLKLMLKLFVNPVMLAIVGGILFSLTGWKLPLYLDQLCSFAGNTVTPLASFSIGVFMYKRLPKGWSIWTVIVLQMVVKFFFMPLLVMPFLLAFGIQGAPRQVGVLMAALPVALSCYVLSVRYRTGQEHATIMVVGTSILMLPTQLMWLAITESMNWN